jgi:hypothetical protein
MRRLGRPVAQFTGFMNDARHQLRHRFQCVPVRQDTLPLTPLDSMLRFLEPRHPPQPADTGKSGGHRVKEFPLNVARTIIRYALAGKRSIPCRIRFVFSKLPDVRSPRS